MDHTKAIEINDVSASFLSRKNMADTLLTYPQRDFLRLHFRRSDVTNLGPGIRYGLWVQGCLRHCEGCVAPESRIMDGGSVIAFDILIREISHAINKQPPVSGITISGGEPMLQWKELFYVIKNIKQAYPDLTILLYTGYSWEQDIAPCLLDDGNGCVERAEFSAFFDALDWWIDGEYQAQNDDGRGLRGSSNQKLYGNIPMGNGEKTRCYQGDDGHWVRLADNTVVDFPAPEDDSMRGFAQKPRFPQFKSEQDGFYLVGIPTKEALETFNKLVACKGCI
ncbi:MAG: radical SAM protein [Treponema sp.]|jgi:anaerobic ribonucleoside-triphosphate reductase activating protein|nr:radical SAM protein [Treponema sp.]